MNMDRRDFLFLALAGGAAAALPWRALGQTSKDPSIGKVVKTDAEWKALLSPEQYNITREQGTEAPFSSPLNNIHEAGIFSCVCCDLPLFDAKTKFDSHTGWPSFWAPIAKTQVRELEDKSLGDIRTEVRCARCDAHVGHVFDDGPPPTGLRYCMNGVALKFSPKPTKDPAGTRSGKNPIKS
jgi:peptide-methionine (R)-S-oxide reductase